MNRKSALKKIKDPQFYELCDRIVDDMKRLDVPGVAVGVWNGSQEFSAGFGVTSAEHPLPVTPDTLFQVGSISKTFTGTLLMLLAEKGKLDLDQPVQTYLPKLKLSDPEVTATVTTRHLLTHTGGWVGDYFNDFGNGDDALKKMVKSLDILPQVTRPGELWSYNNAGFNIAGYLVEMLTKQPFENAAQKLLLDPLGMNMTFFFPSDIMITHRFVAGHMKYGQEVRVARPWAIGRAGAAVGGVVSTVRDLLRYGRFHMSNGKPEGGKKLISVKSLKAMRAPQADAGGRGKIGITWFIREMEGITVYGHGGATKGQQAIFHFIPEKDFAVAVLTNSDDGGVITANILPWIMDIYFGITTPAPQPRLKQDDELAEFTGSYDLPLSAFNLEARDGYLVMNEIPRGGFPTPDSPAGPAMPPIRLAFYENDKVIGLDEPMKNALGDFIRGENGQVRFLRIGGRAHPKVG